MQDIFFGKTCEVADVVLPAAPSLEKEGTFTSTERRIGRLLTAWSVAGIFGPLLVNRLRNAHVIRYCAGADAYSFVLYVMAGLLIVGLVANALVVPVGQRIFCRRFATPSRDAARHGHRKRKTIAMTTPADPAVVRPPVTGVVEWLYA